MIEICRQRDKSFLISAWYRPPYSDENPFDNFETYIKKCDRECKDRFILGDPNCDWNK